MQCRMEFAVVEDEAGDHRGQSTSLAPGQRGLQGQRLLEGDALAPSEEEGWPTKGWQQPSTGGKAASSRGGRYLGLKYLKINILSRDK